MPKRHLRVPMLHLPSASSCNCASSSSMACLVETQVQLLDRARRKWFPWIAGFFTYILPLTQTSVNLLAKITLRTLRVVEARVPLRLWPGASRTYRAVLVASERRLRGSQSQGKRFVNPVDVLGLENFGKPPLYGILVQRIRVYAINLYAVVPRLPGRVDVCALPPLQHSKFVICNSGDPNGFSVGYVSKLTTPGA
ncbi:hypothetical protein B0H66DRAFT_15991 [Apodospora peruviana]|uniref:Uncharacterized protein n=1 Tax=Apodospora peruviana TaxID=516989 RepID=A0AAE0IQD1_9PEZI|nr:hypothetical protein B0H66DRAFT_15991 [Apodospora peruviana]